MDVKEYTLRICLTPSEYENMDKFGVAEVRTVIGSRDIFEGTLFRKYPKGRHDGPLAELSLLSKEKRALHKRIDQINIQMSLIHRKGAS